KYTLENDDIASFTKELINKVKNHPFVKLHMETEVTAVAGFIGNFEITLTCNDKKTIVPCGAIIVATGASNAETKDFLYGQSENIITQQTLEDRLSGNKPLGNNQNIVMIQCAGSRNDEHAYCSRLCCSMAVKNALKIKKQSPDANIFVLYRDIRTYGFRETYYKQAREAGVIFIRYEKEAPPVVSENNGLTVTINSPDFPEAIEIEAGTVVLSTGVVAPKDNRRIADLLKVPLNSDGFFVEAHLKLRPVDFATEGIFLCGLAHSPKMIDENISQARAAAARATTVLSKTILEVGAQVSAVDQEKCISCMTCVRACPYDAPMVNVNKKAEITTAKCMGCGICSAECPAHAIQLNHFGTMQFTTMLDELFKIQTEEKKPEAYAEVL
ncbi:MAG: 4Fe-4S binding protein, partial [Chloroflexi bacterium]|nr:4Fe-4S binding protein [Chloroflexota bacterium]